MLFMKYCEFDDYGEYENKGCVLGLIVFYVI